MLHNSLFFKLFPPPKYLTMPHTGLEISDDAIRCIEYGINSKTYTVGKYSKLELPPGLIDGGDVSDEKKFTELLSDFAKQNKLSYVKVSLPEEKVYLFQTDIPSTDVKTITQNVEFKLEENVPLSVADAVFYFDILPSVVTGGALRASVSVTPRAYVEKLIALLKSLNMTPMAFEVAPKSIARASIPMDSDDTELIIHAMNKKTGIYIVSGGVVCFSSTSGWGSRESNPTIAPTELDVEPLLKEINRIYAYWMTRPDAHSSISRIILAGRDAPLIQLALRMKNAEGLPPTQVAHVWRNVFDVNEYMPPISRDDSLEYAVAAGLALPL